MKHPMYQTGNSCIKKGKKHRYKHLPNETYEWCSRCGSCRSISKAYVPKSTFETLNRIAKNRCMICNNFETNGNRLSVDHNHKNKLWRGLLCNKCNRGLGYFNDSEKLLLAAYVYLKTHPGGYFQC